MSNLPENWVEVSLPEISTIEMGQSPDSSTYNDQRKGLPFFQGKAEFGKLYPTVRKWCSQPKKIAEAGDILLSVRAPVGPTNLALEKCCIGRGLAAIRAKEHIHQKYLLHYFRNIEPWLTQQGTGSTFTAISGSFIRELQIPLAPLDEQKRIAEKLDSLLARVDSCQTHLERVPQILKRFRQSVLAAATSDRLTEDWREEEGVKRGWDELTFNDLLAKEKGSIRRGPFGSAIKKSFFMPSGYKVYEQKNAIQNNADLGEYFIGEEKYEELISFAVKPGDFLVSCAGTIGRITQLPINTKPGVINQALMRVRVNHDLVNDTYFKILFQSPDFQKMILEETQGSAMQNMASINTIKELHISIPSIEEQAEIVRRVEKLFIYAERLEARYTSASEHVERLTPSLLAKAFRGELVEQEQG